MRARSEGRDSARGAPPPPGGFSPRAEASRYGRYVGVIGLVIVVLITLNTVLTKSRAGAGIAPGERVPPFAVPLATGTLEGDANFAVRPNEGSAGQRAACTVVGARILNICQLYERGPVVLALFVNSGSCAHVLDRLRALAPQFPGVSFAAVAIRGDRRALRALVRARAPNIPVGFDRDGALVSLYKMISCPQITLAEPGGTVQSRALLELPSLATLRARVAALEASARRHHGWSPPGR